MINHIRKGFAVTASAFAAIITLLVAYPTEAPASDPTAALCTPAQRSAFRGFAPANSGWFMDACAVAGPYAFVAFFGGRNRVNTVLTQGSSGQWTIAQSGSGQFSPQTIVQWAPAMPLDTAQSLYSIGNRQNQ
jgi:hypothetical protein